MKRKEELSLLFSFLKGCRLYFFLGAAGALFMTFFDMLIPQMIRTAVDETLPGTAGGDVLLNRVFLSVVLAAAAGALFRWFSTLMNALGGETLVRNMHNRLYCHTARLSFLWHSEHAAGDIIQRCTSDTAVIKNFCSEQLYNLVRVLLMIGAAMVFMFGMNVPLTLTIFAFVPLIVGYSTIFLFKVAEQFEKCDENEGVLSSITQENLTGVRVVRAFGAEAREEEKFRKQNNVYTDAWMKLCEILAWFWAFGDLASGLQVMAVVLLGAYFTVQGKLTAGEYLAFISYNAMLVWPIRTLGRMISEMSKSGVSLRRILDILSAEPEAVDPPQEEPETVKSKRDSEPADMSAAADASEEEPAVEDIDFKHVSFAFGKNEVLSDINVHVPAGSTVGIIGRTGCGKSTLMHLLLRLYELPADRGTIEIGGRDIRTMSLYELRKKAGIVLQEPFLFSRTIGENIAITGIEDEAKMQAAIEEACLAETVAEFPDGLNTKVGERGVTLSGGQKQRLAIARALTGREPVLIFDDSLSAVDAETDSRIRRTLREELGGHTVFLISHRITTLMHADMILCMEKGRIAECGTHDELVEKNGLYAHIWKLQSVPDADDDSVPREAVSSQAADPVPHKDVREVL